MTHTGEVLQVMEADSGGGGGGGLFSKKQQPNGPQRSIQVPYIFAIFVSTVFLSSVFLCGFLLFRYLDCYEANMNHRSASGNDNMSAFLENYDSNRRSLSLQNVRLPTSLKPHLYTIEIVPFIWEGNFTFNGHVSLVLNVTTWTKNITLHANKLKILEWSVYRLPKPVVNEALGREERLRVTGMNTDVTRQFIIFQLNDYLTNEYQYRINIRYIGYLNDHMQGFYRSSYKSGNVKRWIAATQFQATDARQAFPCLDEPALKAKFVMKIGRPVNMTSLSNMPIAEHSIPIQGTPNYVMDVYKESVPMSTYLVAFVVTDFYQLSDGRVHVWARKEAIEQARYAMQIASNILDFYEQFFKIPFPLPKIDMIALPDFNSGAMENWGLITYRETAMLYQAGVSTRYNKENVASIIAHELAHQWFGNLVTPEWWSDLWLNEGFATYIEYLGSDAVEPSWKSLEQFVVEETQNVMKLDALLSSHPISVEVHNPEEINEIFDGISYSKGAAVIRMMDHFLGRNVFKRGVTNYLMNKSYQSATQDDLWEALTVEAYKAGVLDKSVTVKKIMDTWTLQTGFPLVTVTRNYKDGSIQVSQNRFLVNLRSNSTSPGSKVNTLWWIPLTLTTKSILNFSETRPTYWMKSEPHMTIQNLRIPDDEWVLFNIKETGYFRVNYDARNWQLLIDTLNDPDKFHIIDPINRAQLVNDALRLAHAGVLNYTIALDVTQYLRHETEYIPWMAALNDFEYIEAMLSKRPAFNAYKVHMLNLISKLYESTGFMEKSSDDQLMVYRRVEVLHQACRLDLDDCLRNAVTQFQNWKYTPQPDLNNPISANLKGIVYCTAIKVGGQKEWDFAWQRFLKSNVASEKDILLAALGCSREPWILNRYLEWAMNETSGIKKQDMVRVFSSVASNVIGQPLAWAFVRDQWDRIVDYLGNLMFSANSIVASVLQRVNSQYELNEVIKFAEKYRNTTGVVSRSIAQSVEKVSNHVSWMQENYKEIVTWLNNKTNILSNEDSSIARR